MIIFFREIKGNIKSLIFWSIGMALLIALGIGKFSGMDTSGQSINELVASMPKSIQALFGFAGFDISTAIGFYGVLFLYILLSASLHAAVLGAGIISKEERDRTFEFLYVRPVSRTRIIAEKFFAAICNIFILNIVALLVSIGVLAKVSKENIINDILLLMLGMFIMQLIFISIGMAVSVIVKNSKSATGIASMVVIITYLLSVILDLNEKLAFLKFFTPFNYFGAKTVMDIGISLTYTIISAVVVLAALYAAWVFHNRRDLTV